MISGRDKLLLVVLLLISIAKSLFFLHVGFDLLDNSHEYFTNGQLITEGKVIYKDFESLFAPGADYQVALILFFTENIMALRYLHIAIFIFLPLILYISMLNFSKNRMISFLSVLLLIIVPFKPFNFFIFTPLIFSLFLFWKYLEENKKKYLIFSSIFLVSAGLVRYDFSASLYLSSITVFAFRYLLNKNVKNFKKNVFSPLLTFSMIPATAIFISLFILIKNNLLELMLNQIVLVPLRVAAYGRRNLLFPTIDLSNNFLSSVNVLLESAFYWFFISILIFTFIHFVRNKKEYIWRKLFIFQLIMINILEFPYMFGNMDSVHLLMGGGIYCLILIPYVYEKLSKRIFQYSLVGVIILFLMLFLSESVWWFKFNDTLVDFGPKGSFYINSQYVKGSSHISSETYIKAVDFLKKSSSNYVFVAPYIGSLYYFSGKLSPVIYTNTLPGYIFEPYNEEYIIKRLKEKNVERVIYDSSKSHLKTREIMKKNIYVDLDGYLMQNYKINYESKEGLLFMTKKSVVN